MSDIKVYRHSHLNYVFEVDHEDVTIPSDILCLAPTYQACYFPVLGSIACHELVHNEWGQSPIQDGLWFPKDGCRDASESELEVYEKMALV